MSNQFLFVAVVLALLLCSFNSSSGGPWWLTLTLGFFAGWNMPAIWRALA